MHRPSSLRRCVVPSVDDEQLTRHLRSLLQAIPFRDQPVIAAKRLPATPDAGIAITVYATEADDHRDGGARIRRVQFWSRGRRGDPFSADRLGDDLLAHLHWLHSDPVISRAQRLSFALLGPDGNGRDERTDNYQVILRP